MIVGEGMGIYGANRSMVSVPVAAAVIPAVAMAVPMTVSVAVISAPDNDTAIRRPVVVGIRVIRAVGVWVDGRWVHGRVIRRVWRPIGVWVPIRIWIRRPADDDCTAAIKRRDADRNTHVHLS
jgi:hypothetical protein